MERLRDRCCYCTARQIIPLKINPQVMRVGRLLLLSAIIRLCSSCELFITSLPLNFYIICNYTKHSIMSFIWGKILSLNQKVSIMTSGNGHILVPLKCKDAPRHFLFLNPQFETKFPTQFVVLRKSDFQCQVISYYRDIFIYPQCLTKIISWSANQR